MYTVPTRVTDNLIIDTGKPLVLRFKYLVNGRNIEAGPSPSSRGKHGVTIASGANANRPT